MNPKVKEIFKQWTSFFRSGENTVFIYSCLVLTIAIFTFFRNYENPPAQFWDENYHIASAQKYIDGVMFMECHPPLGKLFIALGEYMFRPNEHIDTRPFLQTDFITQFPEGYSFRGMRFFPTFFATISALLFFLILYKFTLNPHTAFLFSSLYLFENAIILHSRAAMLESTQMFFIFLAVLYFISLINKGGVISPLKYLLLGLICGLVISVKVNGAIVLLLFVFLYFYDQKNVIAEKIKKFKVLPILKGFALRTLAAVFGVAFVFCFIFYIHFALGREVEVNRFYRASDAYKEILVLDKTSSLMAFPVMLRDNIIFMQEFHRGVPALDKCKPGENGSHPLDWIVGNKSINYRWERRDGKVSYLYLHGNPVIWFSALAGVLLSFALIAGWLIFSFPVKNKRLLFLAAVFFTLYVCYFIAVLRIDRVMYLYHYFIPLTFGMMMFYIIISMLFENELKSKDKVVYLSLILFAVIVAYVFWFFSPFTYYEPLTTNEFLRRVWFDFWKLEYVR